MFLVFIVLFCYWEGEEVFLGWRYFGRSVKCSLSRPLPLFIRNIITSSALYYKNPQKKTLHTSNPLGPVLRPPPGRAAGHFPRQDGRDGGQLRAHARGYAPGGRGQGAGGGGGGGGGEGGGKAAGGGALRAARPDPGTGPDRCVDRGRLALNEKTWVFFFQFRFFSFSLADRLIVLVSNPFEEHTLSLSLFKSSP